MSTPCLTPLYLGKNRSDSGLLSTANTNRDGTGTIVDLLVADATYGSLVERIAVMSVGAITTLTSANVIRMWAKRSATYRLLAEFAIAAATPSAIIGGGFLPGASAAAPWLTINKRIAGGDTLSFSIHTVAGTQDNYHVMAEGGDYALP
jgi:hypothetical protein